MSNTEKLFINEDTSKPENRLNIALFHSLMIDEVRVFVVQRLRLASGSVIYPSVNLTTSDAFGSENPVDYIGETDFVGSRPDFVIETNGKKAGYIEVELGSDNAQVEKYRTTGRKVYAIYGKREYTGCDLGLDELYRECLCPLLHRLTPADQKYWSLKVIINMIEEYIINGGFRNGSKRVAVSDSMRKHPVIQAILEKIPEDYIKEGENTLKMGYISLNTIKEGGFSVRIYSEKSKKEKSLAVISKNSKSVKLLFPSYKKLVKYTDNASFVEEYANILITAGLKNYKEAKGDRLSLELERLLANGGIGKLIDCIKKYCVF
jgi:hypothetical protein